MGESRLKDVNATALLEQLPDAVFVVDKTGAIVYANPNIVNVFGYEPAEVIGHTIEIVLPDEMRKKHVHQRNAYINDPAPRHLGERMYLTAQHKSGKRFDVDVALKPLVGELAGFVMATARDLSFLGQMHRKQSQSIRYARRIQDAISLSVEDLDGCFDDFFVFSSPKDVVSGDFFWHQVHAEEVYLAVADCTGHGVPGALMSMLGQALFSQTTLRNTNGHMPEPHEVLAQVDEDVKKSLNQSRGDNQVHDGMDVALCRFNYVTRELMYSGAKRPLFIFRDGQLIEIKPSRFSIGGNQRKEKAFACKSARLYPKDRVYLFSDGVADQFGGPDNRKFGLKRLRELLADIQHLDLRLHRQVLESELTEWRGDRHQTDDMMMAAFEVSP